MNKNHVCLVVHFTYLGAQGHWQTHMCGPAGQHRWFSFILAHREPRIGLIQSDPGIPVYRDELSVFFTSLGAEHLDPSKMEIHMNLYFLMLWLVCKVE